MKKLFAIFSVAALSLVVATPAGAFSTFISNVNDDSYVSSTATWSLLVKVQNNNSAYVVNSVKSTANSGYNVVASADDMEDVSIVTGDTDAASLADTTANTNSIEEDLDSGADDDTTIENIDDASTVESEFTDEVENDVTNNNSAEVVDEVDAVSDTGNNVLSTDDSVTNAHIVAGKAITASGAVKLLNSNIKSIVRQ